MRRLSSDESGAVLVIVGLLIVVLVGFAGLAIDVGLMMAERRELRNGADAAALAIAEDCATGAKACDSGTAWSTAGAYASANARDGASGVHSIVLDPDAGSVRVVTDALDADSGQRGVPTAFMRLFGFDRMTVRAPATAIWNTAVEGFVMPLTFALCERQRFTGAVMTLYYKDGAVEGGDPCGAQPAGKDEPGAFGWLRGDFDEQCNILIELWDYVYADPGASPPGGGQCAHQLEHRLRTEPKIAIPIYDTVTEQGSNTLYHIVGFSYFTVDAFQLSGNAYHPSSAACDEAGREARCITGRFTSGVIPFGTPGEGPFYGAYAVSLVE